MSWSVTEAASRSLTIAVTTSCLVFLILDLVLWATGCSTGCGLLNFVFDLVLCAMGWDNNGCTGLRGFLALGARAIFGLAGLSTLGDFPFTVLGSLFSFGASIQSPLD